MTNRLRLLLLILALGMMAIPVPAAGQEPGPIYTVQAGDTLSAIARRFGISQEALISANAIADPSRLFPGQALVLPGFPGIQGELALRTVELGETLTTLSRLYSVSPQDLARLNHMVRDDTAFVGQDMIVPVQAEAMGLSGVAFNRLTQPGDTRLELAAQSGLSPWLGSTEAFGALRYWQLPGTLSYGIGEPDSKGFPSQIEDFSLVPLPLIQGRTTIFQVGIQEGYTLSGSLGDADLTFFPSNDGRWVALQGIHAMAEPGLLDLHITVTQADTLETVFGFSQRLMIEEGDYGFQYLNGVPPETVDQAYTQPEEELIRALLAPKTETKLWDGAFDYPSRYYTEEFVSIFGTRRNYNNGALLYYH
ncbi:MAG: LysM peptidoglycan-binding domain-containing protein, partial [Anaerolineales bacterium]